LCVGYGYVEKMFDSKRVVVRFELKKTVYVEGGKNTRRGG